MTPSLPFPEGEPSLRRADQKFLLRKAQFRYPFPLLNLRSGLQARRGL